MLEDVHLPVRREDLQGDQKELDRVAREVWWSREIAQAKRERLWLDKASGLDVDLLETMEGQSLVCIERTLFGTRNLPLEYRIARCDFGPDLYYVSY